MGIDWKRIEHFNKHWSVEATNCKVWLQYGYFLTVNG
jgi:hypothetical protein